MNSSNIETYIEDCKSKYRSFKLMAKYYPAKIEQLKTVDAVNSEIALAESRYNSWGEEKFIREMEKKAGSEREITGIEALGKAEADIMSSIMGR